MRKIRLDIKIVDFGAPVLPDIKIGSFFTKSSMPPISSWRHLMSCSTSQGNNKYRQETKSKLIFFNLGMSYSKCERCTTWCEYYWGKQIKESTSVLVSPTVCSKTWTNSKCNGLYTKISDQIEKDGLLYKFLHLTEAQTHMILPLPPPNTEIYPESLLLRARMKKKSKASSLGCSAPWNGGYKSFFIEFLVPTEISTVHLGKNR